jgi:uridine kinase
MENMISVSVDGVTEKYPTGIYFEKIVEKHQKQYQGLIALVVCDGKIRELGKRVYKDCAISFLTMGDDVGHKTYVRTAIFILIKAIYDVVGTENVEKIKVEFSLGKGYYCSGKGNFIIDEKLIEKVNLRMRELVNARTPIEKNNYPIEEAIAMFNPLHLNDKESLFRFRRSSTINVYTIDGFHDYFYGYMLPNAGYIKYFKLELYENGFMLILPSQE